MFFSHSRPSPLAALCAPRPTRLGAVFLASFFAATTSPTLAQVLPPYVVEQFADIVAGPSSSSPLSLFAHGDRLYFNTWSGAESGLYRTDGASVERVSQIDAFARIVAGDTLYFTDGTSLYIDGGSSLTQLGAGQFNLSATTFPSEYIEYQNQLYFTADNKLFRSDGTGVEPVAAASRLDSARFLTRFGDRLAFSAVGPYGREAYVTDGTTVELLGDINPGVADSSPGEFTEFGGQLYFSARGPAGYELYRYGGASAAQVADINPGVANSSPNHLTPLNDALIFSADGPQGRELYKTDGATTTLLADIRPGAASSNPQDVFNHQFATFRDELLFVARPGDYSPYRTDGATVSPLPLSSGQAMSGLSAYFTVAGDDAYFLSGTRLHWYDGQFVRPLSDLHVRSITIFRGEPILNAEGPDGIELYVVRNGDVVPLADIFPGVGYLGDGVTGPFSSNPGGFVEFKGSLYFSAQGPNGVELYRLSVVPEPSPLTLAAVAGVTSFAARRRRRKPAARM